MSRNTKIKRFIRRKINDVPTLTEGQISSLSNIDGNTNKRSYSTDEETKVANSKTKTDLITITSAKNLETIASNVDTNNNKVGITPQQAADIEANKSGPTIPVCHLTITSTQNMGGANGTQHTLLWDGTQLKADAGFTHSTSVNPERITVTATGRYSFYWSIGITQGGSSRTTFMSSYKINAGAEIIRGRQRDYSRGSGYGDTNVGMNTEVELTANDYIECIVTVDDADGTYTSNAIIAESELILKKIG